MTKKAQRLFKALRDPEVDNFALVDGSIDGTPAHFIIAEGEDEDGEDDVPVALILDKKMFSKLEALIDQSGSEDDDDEDDDEEAEIGDDDEAPGRRYRP